MAVIDHLSIEFLYLGYMILKLFKKFEMIVKNPAVSDLNTVRKVFWIFSAAAVESLKIR